MVLQHAIVAFSVAAILAPFSYYAGLGARLLRLPQITGYLVSGIVCGPYLLGILSRESVTDLNIIEGVCLSIIGLAAGAELDWPSLARSRKQVRPRQHLEGQVFGLKLHGKTLMVHVNSHTPSSMQHQLRDLRDTCDVGTTSAASSAEIAPQC